MTSSVTKWPDRTSVLKELREWARGMANANVVRIGCIGSYARGDWGFGSDLDIVVILRSTTLPLESRGRAFDTTALPVPADLMVFTEQELRTHQSERFKRMLAEEAVWVWPEGDVR